MYRKALTINKKLGRKAGIAIQYGNLGNVYQTRGDLDEAEALYRQALDLFQTIGAAPRVELVQGLLAELRQAD